MSTVTKRVAPLTDADMTAEQRAIAAEIAAARGGTFAGPFAIWMRVPEIAKRINDLSERLRKNSTFDKRLVELMVLTVTGWWSAEYAWNAHAKHALAEGISAEAIEAIRNGGTPVFTRADEQLVYDVFSELQRTRALADATYDRGIAMFGLDRMIEMVATAGLYTTISMTLRVFDVASARASLA